MLSMQFLLNNSLAICGVFMASDRVKPCHNTLRKELIKSIFGHCIKSKCNINSKLR